MESLKPSRADSNDFISQLVETPGWKYVLGPWLEEQIHYATEKLKIIPPEELLHEQGRIQGFEQLKLKINEHLNEKRNQKT